MNKNLHKPHLAKNLLKVGVMDSGAGGKPIFDRLKEKCKDSNIRAEFFYFADKEHFPYGNRPTEEIIEIVAQVADQFIQRNNLSILVLACNTASTLALDLLRKRFPIPIVGTVPAIKPAAQQTKSKHLALLSTSRTADGSYVAQLKEKFAPDCTLHLFAAPGLVLLSEKKASGHHITIQEIASNIQELKSHSNIDTVVLGCTHFVWLRQEIREYLGEKVTIVDSTEAIVERTICVLTRRALEVTD